MPSIASEEEVKALAVFLKTEVAAYAASHDGRGMWTDAVYSALSKYATLRKWRIYPEEKPKLGEFLLDFMLLEENYGARIGCESEWWHPWTPSAAGQLGNLEKDFEKLTFVKADIKLFIFEGEDSHLQMLGDKYLTSLAHLRPDEAFLAVRYQGAEPSFFWWQPKTEGVQQSVTFSRLQI